jgi:MMP alpha-(1->4)-mannosyltransferase
MTRPLRICFVAYRGNMHCGGQGIYLWSLARELARQGHHIDVWVGPPYPDAMPFARAVHQLPNERFWGRWWIARPGAMLPRPNPLRAFEPINFFELAASRVGFLTEPFAFSLRAFRAVAAALRRGTRYDVVHDVQCLGYGVLGLRALGLPAVSTVHHPLSIDRRASYARDRTLREAIGTTTFYPVPMQACVARRLDRVFTSSAASARHIARDFGVDPARIRMLANGIDTDLFYSDTRVPRDPARILCVGRSSDPNKSISTLIDALPHLPAGVQLTLIDEDHALNPARLRAEALGCGERLVIRGRLSAPALVDQYRRAALVVVPSRYEGFGLPAVEAMACGTPVVAAAAGALPEVIEACGGGLLVPPGDPRALAHSIGALLARPAQRDALGTLGSKGARAAYGWPRVAERTARAYVEAIDEARGRPTSSTTSASAGS